jgi:hypothetical protein
VTGSRTLHIILKSHLHVARYLSSIRAWEFVDAVDAPTKIPHLFYQCQIKDSLEQDAIYAGHPYQHYNSVQIKPGDPVPTRLAGLRRLMNERARHLYCAPYEYDSCNSIHGEHGIGVELQRHMNCRHI